MQGVNDDHPITGGIGLVFTPETIGQTFKQMPLIFDFAGALQGEYQLGTGNMKQITGPLVTPPAGSKMIAAQAFNRGYLAFSAPQVDANGQMRLRPSGPMAVYSVERDSLDPGGLKPFGFGWTADTEVEVGEVVCPSTIDENNITTAVSNGHTYRCITAGRTGTVQPTWPLTENATFGDGTAQWEEYTLVLANRLPAPNAPTLALTGGGTYAGTTVYVFLTMVNGIGETIAGAVASIDIAGSGQAVTVQTPTLASLPKWIQGLTGSYAPSAINIYAISGTTGGSQPPLGTYEQAASVALGTLYTLTADPSSGIFAPSRNGARITSGMLSTPSVAPTATRTSAAGSFPAGRDVYLRMSYTNVMGETTLGPSSVILDTQLNDAVQVAFTKLVGYSVQSYGLYEADVATGGDEPAVTEFNLVGYYQVTDTPAVTATATGHPAPSANTTGPAGNIAADTAGSAPNNADGQRYAVVAYENTNGTISGITVAQVQGYFVDENGWELPAFNVAIGPSNIKRRIIGLTVADGDKNGPFGYISQQIVSGGILMLPTVIDDNTSTSLVMNFTDTYLTSSINAGNNLTPYLQNSLMPPAVQVTYLPSLDRLALCGVESFENGVIMSQPGDGESIRLDVDTITTNDGQRTFGTCEYKETVYAIRERSGFVITPSAADTSQWSFNQRWSKVGACGPSAYDVCQEFIIFVHRSGVYIYTQSEPVCVSDEIAHFWNTINWKWAEYIWCNIDVEHKVVRIGVPTGNSKVPNQTISIWYEEGWDRPTASYAFGKEIGITPGRKYSFDDYSGFFGMRIERAMAPQPAPDDSGDYETDVPEGSIPMPTPNNQFDVTQYIMGSSGNDGTVQAIMPGQFNDNGAGIDWQYETSCPKQAMAVCTLEGFTLNAFGSGDITVEAIAGRKMVTNFATDLKGFIYRFRSVTLTPDQSEGITRMAAPKKNERWRLRFTNGKQPNVWAQLKYCALYTLPIANTREVKP